MRRLPRNNLGASTYTLRFGGRCPTGGYESELEAPLCHYLTPRHPWVAFILPGHNKIHDTHTPICNFPRTRAKKLTEDGGKEGGREEYEKFKSEEDT